MVTQQDIESMVRRYTPHVWRIAMALTHDEDMADEVTQLTFIQAFRSLDMYRGENISVNANPEIAEAADTIDAGLPPTPIAACFHLGDTALQQDFNQYLAEIKADGSWDRIMNKWMGCKDVSAMPIPVQHGTGKVLTIATSPDMAPYNYLLMGKPTGFEIELITEWANRRNYRLKYLFMEFASQIPAVQTGKANMAIGRISDTEERRKNVLFSDGYYNARTLFYTRKGELKSIFKD